MYGCKVARPVPWDEESPQAFGGIETPEGEEPFNRCPLHYLVTPDPWRDEVVSLVRDYRAGVITGWPDRYTAQTVTAVRFAVSELERAESDAMERVTVEANRGRNEPRERRR